MKISRDVACHMTTPLCLLLCTDRRIGLYIYIYVHEEKTKKTNNLTNMKISKEQEALLLLILSRRRKQRLQQKKRRIWVHEILQKRKELGEYHTLVGELISHEDRLYTYVRMSQGSNVQSTFCIVG